MMKSLSSVRWGRILLASVATHVINLVVTVLAIFGYAMASTLPSGGKPVFVDQLAGGIATWGAPVLTFFAAAWVALKLEAGTSRPARLIGRPTRRRCLRPAFLLAVQPGDAGSVRAYDRGWSFGWTGRVSDRETGVEGLAFRKSSPCPRAEAQEIAPRRTDHYWA